MLKVFRGYILLVFVFSILLSRSALAGTITVNSTLEGNTSNTIMTITEAVLISNGGTGASGVNRVLTDEEKAQVAGGSWSGSEDNWTLTGGAGSSVADTIDFSVTGTIETTSALTISDASTTISAEGKSITIDGVGTAGHHGITISNVGSCVIKGLVVQNCQYGIQLTGASATANKIQNCYIGVNAAGDSAVANNYGIYLQTSASSNIIGTDGDGSNDAAEMNVISGNTLDGVYITAAGVNSNEIAGNYIGLNAAGTAAVANGRNGVYIYIGSASNIIGTDGDGTADSAERNVISGNTSFGIRLHASGVSNIVAGNYIGLNAAGTAAVANSYGVYISGASASNIIGTNGDGSGDAAEMNVISGNTFDGVYITGAGTNSNKIAGNYLGLNAAGDAAVPNRYGVCVLTSAASNIIGTDGDGTADAAERNVISGNTPYGIRLYNSTVSNVVAGNYIGLNPAGTAAIANDTGICIDTAAASNIIGTNGDGTADAAERNVVSGNTTTGIYLLSSGTDSNKIAGNYVGLNAAGDAIIGSAGDQNYGIYLYSGPASNTIGFDGTGTAAVERNIVSGNDYGIWIRAANSNTIAGNYVGTDPTGESLFANSTAGIYVSDASQSNIFGTNSDGAGDANEGNVLAGGAYGMSLGNAGTNNNV
ncbi:MAG: hypothetical protein ABIH69_01030, partial [bacterium]